MKLKNCVTQGGAYLYEFTATSITVDNTTDSATTEARRTAEESTPDSGDDRAGFAVLISLLEEIGRSLV